jgi:hypothetical protein
MSKPKRLALTTTQPADDSKPKPVKQPKTGFSKRRAAYFYLLKST